MTKRVPRGVKDKKKKPSRRQRKENEKDEYTRQRV